MIFDVLICGLICISIGSFATMFVFMAWGIFEDTRVGSLFVDWLEEKLKRQEE